MRSLGNKAADARLLDTHLHSILALNGHELARRAEAPFREFHATRRHSHSVHLVWIHHTHECSCHVARTQSHATCFPCAEQDSLCMERSLHTRLVEVVEGAYANVCSTTDDTELAEWCHVTDVPLQNLVRAPTLLFAAAVLSVCLCFLACASNLLPCRLVLRVIFQRISRPAVPAGTQYHQPGTLCGSCRKRHVFERRLARRNVVSCAVFPSCELEYAADTSLAWRTWSI
jgi:hypothetical protein